MKKMIILSIVLIASLFLLLVNVSKFGADPDIAEIVATQLEKESKKINSTSAGKKQTANALKPNLNSTTPQNNNDTHKVTEETLKKAVKKTFHSNKEPSSRLVRVKRDELQRLDDILSAQSKTKYTVNNAGNISGIYPRYSESFSNADEFIDVAASLIDVGEKSQLTKTKEECFGNSNCVTRYTRTAFGYPVLQDDLVVSLNNGSVISAMGSMSLPNINPEDLKTSDTLNAKEIEGLLKNDFGSKYALEGGIVYGIYDAKTSAVPAYQATIKNGFNGYDVIINARNKQVISKTPHIMHADAQGVDLNGNTYRFQADMQNEHFILKDFRFPLNSYTGIFDLEGLTSDEWFENQTYNYITSNSLTSGWDPSAVSVLSHFDSLVAYFNKNMGYRVRVPGDESMKILVNMDEENAFAGLNIMIFGKTKDSNFANSRDVVAHELTHSIISATSNLTYSFQSGALNESFADLFGTLASDDGNWLLGEDIYTNGQYLRNMKNPVDKNQPGHLTEYRNLPIDQDNGGVHINSGIPNRFFYLLAEGNKRNAIGRLKTGKIAFNVLTTLNSNAIFADFYQAMIAQAIAMYGENSVEALAITEAGEGVGFESQMVTKTEMTTISIPESINATLFLNKNFIFDTYNLNLQFFNSNSRTYNSDSVITLSFFADEARPSAGVISNGVESELSILYRKYDGSIGNIFYNSEDGYGDQVFLNSEEAAYYNKISVERQFEKLASSLTGDKKNQILLIDIETQEVAFIAPAAPSFSEGESGLPVELVDVVEFDPTGRFLVFDYLESAEEGIKNWSIGVLEIETGLISYPFAQIPSNISVGNPSFSNVNSDIIIFDALFTESGKSGVYILNTSNGDVFAVASTDSTESGRHLAYPAFTQNDNAAIFTFKTGTNYDDTYLVSTGLDESYNAIPDSSSYLNPIDYALYPRTIPIDIYQDTLTLQQDKTTFEFGDVVSNQTDEICITNKSTHPIRINDKVIDQGIILNSLPNYYNGREKACTPFSIDVDNLALGAFNLGVELNHNGTSPPILLTFVGNKLADTDKDGIPDITDIDDDNDGVLDTADAYPLIAIGDLTDTDSDGAPDNCDAACVELGMVADSDDDNDGVLDTADAYPLISLGELTDTDSDGIPDTCDAACVELGMAADSDDDNDGISDQLEVANGLDPLDSADATLDADNDGVSNIDEANAGSNISADDQPPIFTSTVSDIEVISTGLATVVELVNPTASDVTSDVVVTNDSNGEFPVGITTVTYTATDLAGNTATLTQQVNVLPYLVISSGRSLGEGQIIEIDVTLNGTPATYPVTADIVIGGTASEDDFTLSTTSLLITEGLTQTVSLSAIDDGFGDNGETVVLSLENLVNAGIKPNTDSEQIFTITEEQILPTVNVSVVQDDVIGRTVDKQSNVLFDIDIEDPNGLDSLLVEWSGITSLSQADSSPDLILDTSNMEAGVYVLRLSITDNAVVGDNVVNQLITIKVIDTLPELTSMDSDGDGVSDIEEGFGDSDNDGIADYLDNTPQINLQPIGETFAQAQDGVTLALGATALAGDDNSIVIAPSSLPEDTTYEVKEVFDFTLTGLAVGASYELVLPLTQVIPADAVYRKLTDDGWVDFVEDANNAIHSTSVSGNCPAINSDLWEAGLVEGGNCLKLTIQDGSANDTDGLENGTVEDPSGIAVEKAPATPTPNPTPNTPTNGSGSSGGTNTIQVLILLWLLVIGRRIYLRP